MLTKLPITLENKPTKLHFKDKNCREVNAALTVDVGRFIDTTQANCVSDSL